MLSVYMFLIIIHPASNVYTYIGCTTDDMHAYQYIHFTIVPAKIKLLYNSELNKWKITKQITTNNTLSEGVMSNYVGWTS